MHHQLHDMLRFHRKKSGLTQAELAQMAGVGKNMIHEIENGRQSIQLDNLIKILGILNIHIRFESPLMESFEKVQYDANS